MNPDKDMELEQDLEFLRGQFDELNRGIKLPHSLDPENLLALLDGETAKPQKKKVIWLKPLAGLAACLVVAVGSVYALKGMEKNASLEAPLASSAAAASDAGLAAGQAAAPAMFATDAQEEAAPEAAPAENGEAEMGEGMGGGAQSEPEAPVLESAVPAEAPAGGSGVPSSEEKEELSGGSAKSEKPEVKSGGGKKGGKDSPAGSESTDAVDNTPAVAAQAPETAPAEPSGEAFYASSYTAVRDAVFELTGGMEAYLPIVEESPVEYEESAPEGGPVMRSAPNAVSADDNAKAIPNTAGGYSRTNVQEAGVDEGDIVKTDGKYLYSYVFHNTTSKRPAIYIAEVDELELASKIELETDIREFYVDGDRLVTVEESADALPERVLPAQTIVSATDDSLVQEIKENAPDSGGWNGYGAQNNAVQINLYDITQREQPVLLKTYAQNGDYTASRMEGGVVYLVSNYNVYPAFQSEKARLSELVPVAYDSSRASAKPLAPQDIAVLPDGRQPSYAVISAMDTRTGDARTQAVLGGSDGVYMAPGSLYVYYTRYREQVSQADDSYESTQILRFSADGVHIKLTATGKVDGYADGQFAFSERNGNLRVATTASTMSGVSRNSLYVLDANLRRIGALEGLAPGESIYSVRYVGEMAYLVTFRQVDPLFAVDLSDPTRPKLLGQLKIPGFSEYLHPLEGGLLLGIGQDADQNGVTDGLKLSLFDVSDPLDPKELHVFRFGEGSYSDALNNHRAALIDESRALLGLPVLTRDGSSKERTYDLVTWDREKGFTRLARVSHTDLSSSPSYGVVERGLLVGDSLYTFSPDWMVRQSLKDYEREKTLKLF